MKNNPIVSNLNSHTSSKETLLQVKEFDSFDSPFNLANVLQKYVDNIVQKCPEVDWDENSLSFQVIKSIRIALDGYVLPDTDLSKFDIEAYKLTGKAEQSHGDIAIIVSRSFDNGFPITGVGFYEAKASSLDGHCYPAFSVQQLRRLVTNTPKLSYLLYERHAQISDTQEWTASQGRLESTSRKQSFFARVVDANLVKQYKHLEGAAYYMSQAFGYHFVYKTLSGRELDYSRPPIDTIRRWLKTTRRANALVVSISVRESEKEHFHTQLELPNFDKIRLQLPDQSNTLSRKLLE